MTARMGAVRRLGGPVVARAAVLAASLAAATVLIRVRGLGLFGLLATLLLLARIGSALLLGESQLALARRAVEAPAALAVSGAGGVARATVAVALAAGGAAVAADRFGSTPTEVASFSILAAVLTAVAALLRVAAIALAQAERTSLSATCDISVVAPAAALTFTISDVRVAAAVQIVLLVALAVVAARWLTGTGTARTPVPSTLTGDLVAFAVAVLPMLHGSIGPVLGIFGLDADDVGLLAFAQRLASPAPLILAGGGAAVLAVSPARARLATVQYAKLGGIAFVGFAGLVLAAWPLIRTVLDVGGIGVTVVALVLAANLVNVASGPIGQYCAISGRQRLDLISLTAAVVVLVPFVLLAKTATRAAVAAVVVAVVRAVMVWLLVARAERANWEPAAAPVVGGVGVDGG